MSEAVAPDPVSPAGSPGGVAAGAGWHWVTPAVEMAARECGNWPLARESAPWRWTSRPRVATRRPPGGPGAARAAREFAVATLDRWGVTDRRDDIIVVVSELLTNAFRHAMPAAADQPRWPVRLALLQPGPCVLCAVSDPSSRAPAPRLPGRLDETGRGLHVVASLSDAWGCASADLAAGAGQAASPAGQAVPAGRADRADLADLAGARAAAASGAAPDAGAPAMAAGFLAAPLAVPPNGAGPGTGPGEPEASLGKVVWAMFATGPAAPVPERPVLTIAGDPAGRA